MAASISDEDFQRVQVQVIDLKTQNYALEERCRKYHQELLNAQQRCAALDSEYQKASKTINKSKKIKEVEQLIQENDLMLAKLQSQEDEFRLQNSTLMTELSHLVASNEQLERQVKKLEASASAGETNNYHFPGLIQLQAENSALRQQLQKNQQKQLDDILNVRDSLHKFRVLFPTNLVQPSDSEENSVSSNLTKSPEETSLIEVNEDEVSFHRSSNSVPNEEIVAEVVRICQHIEKRLDSFHNEYIESSKLRLELESVRMEKELLKEQTQRQELAAASMEIGDDTNDSGKRADEIVAKLQDEVEKANEKLKRKQESYMQLHAEKEQVYDAGKKALEDLRKSKDAEVLQLQEMNQRLQTQLSNTLQTLQEHKERHNTTIQHLEAEFNAAKAESTSQAIERLQNLESSNRQLQSELQTARTKLASLDREKTDLLAELQTCRADLDSQRLETTRLETSEAETSRQLEETRKTAEKRKALLDEMAVHLQGKLDEHQVEISRITDEYTAQIDGLMRQLEEFKGKCGDLDRYKLQLDDLEKNLKSLENAKLTLERKLKESEETLENTKKHYENIISEIESRNSIFNESAKSAYLAEVQDYRIQLELSQLRNSELEEQTEQLKQEIKDGLEDRRIQEKKNQATARDLKRQLQMERRRAEKLQEKLQEVLLNAETGARPAELYKVPAAENDRLETGSTGSWSMMSGSHAEQRDASNGSLHNGSPPPSSPADTLEREHTDLLSRITQLQEQNWVLEEKINHLEQNSGAMADDLMRKSSIIQYYCMEGRPDPSSSSSEKLTVKRVVDFIKDRGDENLRDMNRRLQRMLEETLTKNMHLQKDLQIMSEEMARINKQIHLPPNSEP